jgi:hypothetical protein
MLQSHHSSSPRRRAAARLHGLVENLGPERADVWNERHACRSAHSAISPLAFPSRRRSVLITWICLDSSTLLHSCAIHHFSAFEHHWASQQVTCGGRTIGARGALQCIVSMQDMLPFTLRSATAVVFKGVPGARARERETPS